MTGCLSGPYMEPDESSQNVEEEKRMMSAEIEFATNESKACSSDVNSPSLSPINS